MCAVFGLLDFEDKLTPSERLAIFKALGKAAEARGTDATGVAYVQNGTIQIQKAPRPAHRMKWRIPPDARYLMGHTRMATQGSEKKNYNNHPFFGKAGQLPFALAHNGVLFNDFELQKARKLPKTHIETDSYVAVQLIEQYGSLSPKSLKQMALLPSPCWMPTIISTLLRETIPWPSTCSRIWVSISMLLQKKSWTMP